MWSNKEADFFPEINKSFTFPGMGQLCNFASSHAICVIVKHFGKLLLR